MSFFEEEFVVLGDSSEVEDFLPLIEDSFLLQTNGEVFLLDGSNDMWHGVFGYLFYRFPDHPNNNGWRHTLPLGDVIVILHVMPDVAVGGTGCEELGFEFGAVFKVLLETAKLDCF